MDNTTYLTPIKWKLPLCDNCNEMFCVDKQYQYTPDTAQNRTWVRYACLSTYHSLQKLTEKKLWVEKNTINFKHIVDIYLQPVRARFIGPTWDPPEADRTQVGPMLATL